MLPILDLGAAIVPLGCGKYFRKRWLTKATRSGLNKEGYLFLGKLKWLECDPIAEGFGNVERGVRQTN